MLARLLPAACRTAEAYGEDDPAALGELRESERCAAGRMTPRRLGEYAAVRSCARRALTALGEPPAALPRTPGGAPRWPAGVVGSMTHCAGYRAAAVARAGDLLAVGVDGEPHVPLRDGLLERITAGGGELDRFRALLAAEPAVHWDKLLFSAKEAVYKAWSPLTGRRLGFRQAELVVHRHTAGGGEFEARLIGERITLGALSLTGFRGSWAVGRGLVVTAVAVPASGSG